MSENLSNIFLAAASDVDGEGADTDILKASSMIVPKNSGVQMVMSKLHRAKIQAGLFKSGFREIALAMVKARMIGVFSLNSEGGNWYKAMSTKREAHMYAGLNQGKTPDAWDKIIYGKQVEPGSDWGGTD